MKSLLANKNLKRLEWLNPILYYPGINQFIEEINTKGKTFIRAFLSELKDANLTEKEELEVLRFAIQTIYADEKVEYSEIKYFKTIRHRLNVSDEVIVKEFPDLDSNYLEEDIQTESILDQITDRFFESADLPQFDITKFISAERD